MPSVSAGPCAAKDHGGQRFGRLTVLCRDGARSGYVTWRCRCDCGAECVVTGQHLRRGSTTSCGCVARQETVRRATKHGHVAGGRMPPEYRCWASMIARCVNSRAASYPDYGGRGIAVCERWRGDFAAFLEDMGRKPSPDHSIDRINNDGNYEPSNCKWSTRSEQQRNRRSTATLTIGEHRRPVVEWSEITGLTPKAIQNRIASGWPAEKILSVPSDRRNRHLGLHRS